MSNIPPEIIDLESRLLGEMYGRFGVFTNDSIDNGSIFDELNGIGNSGLSTGFKKGIGKEEMHSRFPNEIEYYACALELVDSQNNTLEFFSFPVMPTQYSSTERFGSTLQKSMGGVILHDNPTFIPLDINLSGSFGRMFRRILKTTFSEPSQKNSSFINRTSKSFGSGVTDVQLGETKIVSKGSVFSSDFKTGYGNCKLLERILRRSKTLDSNGRVHKLIFYNLSFNQSYVINTKSLTFSQSRDGSNAIWQYNLSLETVAPISAIFDSAHKNKSLETLLNFNKKNRDFSNQSDGIMSLLNPNGQSSTKMRRILERQIRNKASTAIGDKQKSAINVIQQLSSNPNNIDDFIVNIGENLLNTV